MAAEYAEQLIEASWLNKLDPLLRELGDHQLIWLSGYIAALGRRHQSQNPLSQAPGKVLVAYGTETGNSQSIASDLAFSLNQKKIAFELKNLAQLRARHLTSYQFVLMVCSTHGDGDPPEPMSGFYTSIMDADAPGLTGLQYAVLALGDSSYPKFCATGQALDDRLAALGASRILFRQDCDTDFTDAAAQWVVDVTAILGTKIPKSEPQLQSQQSPGSQTVEYGRNHPLKAEVIDNIRLSHECRRDAIHHIELFVGEHLTNLLPGDALGVLVQNDPAEAKRLIELTGCSEDSMVKVNHRNVPLIQALVEECDITVPSKRLVNAWSKQAKDSYLMDLLVREGEALKSFIRTHHVVDILKRFPARIDAQSLVDALKPLQPRLYDLANSITVTPGELHILVKCYQYDFNDKLCHGVGSRFLSRLMPRDALKVFPYRNNKFHFPDPPDAPVVFIAEGTGIGPFRAYLQEIAHKSHGATWLIFAERSFEDDFLYQSEWQAAMIDNQLSRVDAVFQNHPDQPTVEAVLRENQETLFDLLKQGAHLYLCGDKELLTPVEAALTELTRAGPVSWDVLQESARVHRNLY